MELKYRIRRNEISIGEDGFPQEVLIKTSKDAHKLVEEFMLLANRHVAIFLERPLKMSKNQPVFIVFMTPLTLLNSIFFPCL